MNLFQRVVLILYAFGVVGLGVLWVPWNEVVLVSVQGATTVTPRRYAPLFDPPLSANPNGVGIELDAVRLAVQLAVLSLVAAVLFIAVSRGRR
jgi:hypothetical protein